VVQAAIRSHSSETPDPFSPYEGRRQNRVRSARRKILSRGILVRVRPTGNDGRIRRWLADNRRTTRSAAQLPVDSYDSKSSYRTNGSDEVVHDATSIEGGVFTRSTSFRANNLATQSEVDGGARLGSP
jgi:hypothetical protein